MLLVLFSWIVISLVFIAFGNSLISIWNKIVKSDVVFSVFDTFFLGLCSVGTLTSILSLFSPINIYALCLFILSTLVYWIFNIKLLGTFASQIRTIVKEMSILVRVIFSLVFLIIVIWSVHYPVNPDYSLYHLQSLMWTDQYSVVPGLGNLHGRLAFNSSFFLLLTLFSYHPEFYMPHFTLNGLCFLVFVVWLIRQINEETTSAFLLGIFGTLFFIIGPYASSISSTSTDFLPGLLICYLLFSCVFEKNRILSRILPLSVIAIFCLTLKLSSAVILLLPLYLLILCIQSKKYKYVLPVFLLGFCIITPWCLRYVIQTGYLIYPFPSIDFLNFDWKMPLHMLEDERDWAYAWARIPNRDKSEVLALSIKDWFPEWLRFTHKIELMLFFLTLGSSIYMAINFKRIGRESIISIITWGIALIGCLYCFYTAPNIRFSWGYFIVAAIMPFIVCKIDLKNKKLKMIPFYLFFIFFVFHFSIKSGLLIDSQKNIGPFYSLILKPQAYDSNESYCKLEFADHTMGDKLIYSPIATDRCVDKCLPCTPYFSEKLEFRGNSLQEGFRIRK